LWEGIQAKKNETSADKDALFGVKMCCQLLLQDKYILLRAIVVALRSYVASFSNFGTPETRSWRRRWICDL